MRRYITPTMSSSLTTRLYTPLQKWQTRVLRLHPAQRADEPLEGDLLRAGLADGPYLMLGMDEPLIQFDAISYTWGKPGQVQHEIICSGLSVPILPSLHAALRRFRRTDSVRYLWADALCINQADDVEKSYQVANMFTIFHKAWAVLAWLGEEGPYTSQALTSLRASDTNNAGERFEKNSQTYCVFDELHPDLQTALEDLVRLPWCRRVWIQQEVFAARELTLFCGTQQLNLQEYQALASWILQFRKSAYDREIFKAVSNLRIASESELAKLREQSLGLRTHKHGHCFNYTRALQSRDKENWPHARSIEDTLLRSCFLQAGDPRDYVYALLNLTDCPTNTQMKGVRGSDDGCELPLVGVTIDYTRRLSEILQDVTRFIMNTDQSIAVLGIYEPRKEDADIGDYLPSWTIDWRRQVPRKKYLFTATQGVADFQDYRDVTWKWQYPNSAGTIQLGGVQLAEVRYIKFELKSRAKKDFNEYGFSDGSTDFQDLYYFDIEMDSHISASAWEEKHRGAHADLHWTTDRHRACYQEVVTIGEWGSGSIWEKMFYRLQLVKPNDILVHIDGTTGALAYLRPTPDDKFWLYALSIATDNWSCSLLKPYGLICTNEAEKATLHSNTVRVK